MSEISLSIFLKDMPRTRKILKRFEGRSLLHKYLLHGHGACVCELYLKHFFSFSSHGDMLHTSQILKTSKGTNSVNFLTRLCFLRSVFSFVVLYQCVKFHLVLVFYLQRCAPSIDKTDGQMNGQNGDYILAPRGAYKGSLMEQRVDLCEHNRLYTKQICDPKFGKIILFKI